MKINIINKIYLGIAAVMLAAISIKLLRYKKWERFYYDVSIFAPKYFPVFIEKSEFLLPNDTMYIYPEMIGMDWGIEGESSGNFEESQHLPKKLSIRYVSYREKEMYCDTIELPKEKMMSIFRKAAQQNKMRSHYSSKGDRKALTFIIGIANNGNILVALRGKDFDEVILKKHLKKQSANSKIIYLDNQTRERREKDLKDCFNELFENVENDKDLKNKIDTGYESKANYIDSATNSY